MKRLIKRALGRAGFRLERTRPPKANAPTEPGPNASLSDLGDMVYRVGDWRYEIPLAQAVGRPCFGYGPLAWHPYVAAVKELRAHPGIDFKESLLRRHFEHWQPRSVADSHFPDRASPHPILEKIPAASLFEPWLKRPSPCDDPLDPMCRPAGSPLFGPIAVEEARREFERLREMLGSIEEYGYRPDAFPRGLIKIAVLRHEGEQRYLVAHGQHRAAILAAMGHESIVVGIHRELPPLIDSVNSREWPHVVSGLLDSGTAAAMLGRYFHDTDSSHPSLLVASRVFGAAQLGSARASRLFRSTPR